MESDVRPPHGLEPEPGDTLDSMHDSAFTPQSKPNRRSLEETDSCRICRGEGTDEEPLFYPCKCSGSIKFVHQECLMEWLSHSQKKHCELCKTPFRFTKLYHPHMPQTLPTTVFLRRAALHVVRGFFTWCRGMLVASVWLFWLPWSMRFVWWGLFWIGDGGWVFDADRALNGSSPRMLSQTAASQYHNTSTTTPAFRSQSSHSSLISLLFQSPVLQTIPFTRMFSTFTSHGLASVAEANVTSSPANMTFQQSTRLTQKSLLSGIQFFDNLTSSPAVNKLVTDILEGQIITLSVVVTFILVFLIREWVVQQQPNLNLGGANEGAANAVQDGVGGIVPALVRNPQQQPEAATSDSPSTQSIALEDNIDPMLADEESVEELIAKITATSISVQSTGSLNATIDEKRLSTNDIDMENSTHVIEVRRSLLAFQKRSSTALEDEDAEALRRLLERLNRLKAAVMRRVPTTMSGDLVDNFTKTAEWVNTALQLLIDQEDLEQRQRQLLDLKLQYADIIRRAADLGDAVSGEDGLPAGTGPSASRSRPVLPVRARSSIATEIQRSLEEGLESPDSLTVRSGAAGDVPGEGENESSSGIWRQLEIQANSAVDEADLILDAVRQQEGNDMQQQHQRNNSSQDQNSISTTESSLGQNLQMSYGDDAADLSLSNLTLNEETTTGSESSPMFTPLPTPPSGAAEVASEGQNYEPEAQENRDQNHAVQVSSLDRFWDWVWGDLVPPAPDQERENNDEHIVQDLADEAPFVPFVDAHPENRVEEEPENDEQDPEVLANALQAGLNPNDIEAVEDAEDLEGIMELIGMQGPLAGLFQNSVFCAVLISATVLTAVWFPYLWGKVVLVFLANPLQLAVKAPWLLVSAVTNFVIDVCLFLGSVVFYGIDSITRFAMLPLGWLTPSLAGLPSHSMFGRAMGSVANSAFIRMTENFLIPSDAPASDFYHLSLSSHAALYAIRANFALALTQASSLVQTIHGQAFALVKSVASFSSLYNLPIALLRSCANAPQSLAALLASLPELFRSTGVMLSVFDAASLSPVTANGRQAPWSTADRLIAIFAGYAFFAGAGALYLKAGSPITTSHQGKKIEGIISDVLQQAGGVLKVILIISIEMLLFPLYCGFLLDIATLPLFEGSSMHSRLDLTLASPWTSGFVHWFIGTCYMFHFALFVSMCRKIVRSGVLYFIRDPDDPTFHPVRDVLERSISSQLRKIGFSALVYGALVILCMGSVVWAVSYGFGGIFPIRWSSDAQTLEFPIDLLLYNTLTPLVVHLLKPSKGLHAIYEWWFRKCARALRLSHFLFGEQHNDEEGHGGLEDENGATRSGRFVRAPASDQVRIPKGRRVFVEVDADDNRVDDRSKDEEGDQEEDSDQFTTVYVPPWFRLRISLFVFCLWALTAAAGLGLTVAPLLFGRWALSFFVKRHAKVNDIYTFSIGICALGGAYYAALSYDAVMGCLKKTLYENTRDISLATAAFRTVVDRILRILYTYSALVFLFPTLLALILEFYLIIPLHTYITIQQTGQEAGNIGMTRSTNTFNRAPTAQIHAIHTIYALQDWTLGLLYLRILIRLCLWNPTSRPARALHAIVDRGWLNPNAVLATRCFIIPCTILALLAFVVPLPFGWAAAWFVASSQGRYAYDKVNVMRFAYPAVLGFGVVIWLGWALGKAAGKWRARIRDEVYLIGERLHNFGEKKPPPPPVIGGASGNGSSGANMRG